MADEPGLPPAEMLFQALRSERQRWTDLRHYAAERQDADLWNAMDEATSRYVTRNAGGLEPLPITQCDRTGCERLATVAMTLDNDPRYPVRLCEEHAEWAEGRPRCAACREGRHTGPGGTSLTGMCVCGSRTCGCFGIRQQMIASRQGS